MQANNALMPYLIAISILLHGISALSFGELKHDFGRVEYRSPAKWKFYFTNDSSEPVAFETAHVSCECTKVKYPTAPILPGERSFVEVSYDSSKLGKFYRKVQLFTSAGKAQLIIKGEVIASKTRVDPITGRQL